MTEPFVLTSDDPLINRLNFKSFRNSMIRRVVPFIPEPGQPQTMHVMTPWGSELTAKSGDMLISELDKPEDFWPIDSVIFDETYIVVKPGLCIKRAVTLIVPLADVVGGDEDRMVTVHTLEGPETVRAGDFYLAKGVKGEIWPYPKEKVLKTMRPVD
ncbi:MAG: hypothetical protein JNK32_05375 [Anaerolineales bacterium]|nr:hypothetical protein [Anaerolineales bacterium]